jgi:hypothetical protein
MPSIVVLHTNALLEPARRGVLERVSALRGIDYWGIFAEFSPARVGADLYLAHGNETGHAARLARHCEPQGAYYVLFSGKFVSAERTGNRGLIISANLFESRVEAFLQEWVRRQCFPGWEFLIGDPELDQALECLHQSLASGDLGESHDERESWDSMSAMVPNSLRSKHAEVARSWDRICQARRVRAPGWLTEVRDELLGRPGDKGLVDLLVRVRKG